MVRIEEFKMAGYAWKKLGGFYAEPSIAIRMPRYEMLFMSRIRDGYEASRHLQAIARNETKKQRLGVLLSE